MKQIGTPRTTASRSDAPRFVPVDEALVDTLVHFVERYYAFDGIPFDAQAVRRGIFELVAHADLGGAWLIRYGERFVGHFVLTFGFDLEFGGRQATLTELFVDEDVRRCGIGAATLRHIEETLRERGIDVLELQVEEDNLEAIAFYKRSGLQAHSRIPMSKRLRSR